jgi:putative component of toxin-antitoxin plasmid stabilization module
MADVERETLEARANDPTCKELVATLCRVYPSVKGDYRLLYYRYLRSQGLHLNIQEFDLLRTLYSPETITRRYRELANDNPADYAPTEATLSKRRKNEKVYRAYFKQQTRPLPLGAFL